MGVGATRPWNTEERGKPQRIDTPFGILIYTSSFFNIMFWMSITRHVQSVLCFNEAGYHSELFPGYNHANQGEPIAASLLLCQGQAGSHSLYMYQNVNLSRALCTLQASSSRKSQLLLTAAAAALELSTSRPPKTNNTHSLSSHQFASRHQHSFTRHSTACPRLPCRRPGDRISWCVTASALASSPLYNGSR